MKEKKASFLQGTLVLFAFVLTLLIVFPLSRAAAATLLEADFSSGIIYRFAPDGSRTVYTSGLSDPEGLAFDAAGNCFVTETGSGTINKFATDGTQTIFASGLNGPASLVFDAAGSLFSADFFGGVIYKFDSNGTRTTFKTGLNGPANLIFDSTGRLLEADFHTGNIFRFTADGTQSTFASSVGSPHGLAFDTSGNLFVADFTGGTILRFTPMGTRSTFASGLHGPHGLVFDQAGNLYSADYNSGNIYRFTPDGTRTTFTSGLNNPANLLFQPAAGPSTDNLLNLSTRAFVGTNTGVLIGGFILQGAVPSTLVLRAIGPSLTAAGIKGALQDPSLELHDSSGALLATNDNWQSGPDAAAIQRVGLAPNDAHESVIRATLPAGAYTAIVGGVAQTSGIGLVEIYDLQQSATRAGNISTRGIVLSGDNVMIAGCIIGGSASKRLVVRALGPSLFNHGVNDALVDSHLRLFNANGVLLAENEDWQQGPDATAIQNLGLAPESPLEAAVLVTLPPGAYTGIESPAPQESGVGLIEIFDLGAPP
jgi:sugar lactone lactonase YvrE